MSADRRPLPASFASGPVQDDLDWLSDELHNLLFVAERAGFEATARDLRFAIRSVDVELRQRSSHIKVVEGQKREDFA